MGLFEEIQKALKEAMEEAQRQNLPTPRAGQRPQQPQRQRPAPEVVPAEPVPAAEPERMRPPAPVPHNLQPGVRNKRADQLRQRLRNPRHVREAIILGELLAPPVALRGRGPLQTRRGL